MIPAFLRTIQVNPTKVKVIITDERAPTDLAQSNLPGVPPPTHAPKELFSFYCDPLDFAEHLMCLHPNAPMKVEIEPSE